MCTTEFHNPFDDLPQIHFSDEDIYRSNRWSYHSEADLGLCSQPLPSNRSVILAGIGLHSETFSHGLPPLDPMDRFVLQDFNASPFSSELLHSDRRTKDCAVWPPYENTVPDLYNRWGSPLTEASSPSQSCDTFSASHTDELHQHNIDFRGSISSPMDCHQPYFTHDSPMGFSGQSLELLGGGSVSLGQVQNFQDTGFDHDHAHSELDADCASDDDIPIAHILSNLPYGHHSEDEGIGESIDSVSERFDDEEEDDPEYNPKSAHRSPKATKARPTTASRRSSHSRKLSTASTKSRVSKPKSKKAATAGAVRPFPCPLAGYGCVSTFTSKNEWKRHVSTQHIKLGFWRCDMCPPTDPHNIVHNDFNRKDLFTQHLRRMHATHDNTLAHQSGTILPPNGEGQIPISDEAILAHQVRCYRELRSNPTRSGCMFCSRTFQGDNSWDERMEHVGAHFEQERKRGGKFTGPENWREDRVLHDWLVEEGLIEHEALTGWRIGSGQPLRNLTGS